MREEKLERTMANRGSLPANDVATSSSFRGRTIIFFIDDLHLSAQSVQRTRKGIVEFVDREMTLEDRVAVVSPTGQIGFLQRFSDLKPVVRAAVNRLTHKPYTIRDNEQVPMTEYQAIRIDQGDESAADYHVKKLLEATNFKVPGGIGPPSSRPGGARPTAGMTNAAARRMVKNRASTIAKQIQSITTGTLTTLESLMRSAGQLPGRKILFLISDGFFLNDRSSGYAQRLIRIADAATRGGLVIYSVDAREVVSTVDVRSNRADPEGQIARADIGELAASQDGLNSLAVDTGGKAFFNFPLTDAIKESLRETSNYYLLAWRPANEEQKSPNFKRLEVSIVGRPDLTVRFPRGFFGSEPKANDKESETNDSVSAQTSAGNSTAKPVETALISALAAPSARTSIPTKLSVSFVDVPGSGPVLTTATQMSTDVLSYGADGNQPAVIDLAGIVLNDQGKQAGSFKTRLKVNPVAPAAAIKNPTVVYTHKVPLKPGIYQVRVAARDDKSGRVGSAAQWIEIPDLSSKNLTLATLLLSQAEQVQFSADHRFSRDSQMNLFTIIYNASAGNAGPKLDSQIEVLRGRQRVMASPTRSVVIEPNTDLGRIPYGASIALKTLTPGRYVLRVTINDRNAGDSTVSETLFEVE
jgi:VWFA-related protein